MEEAAKGIPNLTPHLRYQRSALKGSVLRGEAEHVLKAVFMHYPVSVAVLKCILMCVFGSKAGGTSFPPALISL